MIKVQKSKDKIVISGHANFSDYGKDIVCAAVSSIVTTCVNDIYIVDKNSLNYQDDGETITIEIIASNDLVYKLFNNLITNSSSLIISIVIVSLSSV